MLYRPILKHMECFPLKRFPTVYCSGILILLEFLLNYFRWKVSRCFSTYMNILKKLKHFPRPFKRTLDWFSSSSVKFTVKWRLNILVFLWSHTTPVSWNTCNWDNRLAWTLLSWTRLRIVWMNRNETYREKSWRYAIVSFIVWKNKQTPPRTPTTHRRKTLLWPTV